MATWKLSNYHKKNAVERQFWTRDGKTVIREEGYRWGTFYCDSEDRPDVDLKNPDGYELMGTDYDWELDSLDDGCWGDITFDDDMSAEEREEFETAWDEDTYEGVEALGWVLDDTEYHLFGPLELTNADSGESWNGEQTVIRNTMGRR